MSKRVKLADRILPTYTKGEEIFNMVSHIVAAVFGIAALVLGIVISAKKGNGYGVASSIVFGITLLILYTMSSIYHGLSPELMAKRVFQVIDHCSIFLLIAGSYTPFCLCSLREYNPALGWSIFGVIWGMAILGIVFNSIDLRKFKVFSMICYLAMGWLVIFTVKILIEVLGVGGFTLLVLGGVIYTIGAILYAKGRYQKWFHSIFHLCCLLGSVAHILCVLIYVL